jgi:hypothetical protein
MSICTDNPALHCSAFIVDFMGAYQTVLELFVSLSSPSHVKAAQWSFVEAECLDAEYGTWRAS